MSWIDVVAIVLVIVFVALGARMGSLWIGACLIGGFFGAFLVEYYQLPVSEMIGGFPGARLVAGLLLFVGGIVIALVPGWALTKLTHAMFLGVVDSIVGLFTGFLAGVVAIALMLLFVVPRFPSIEKSAPWKKSVVIKPLHNFLEDLFSDSRFQKTSATEQFKDDFVKDFKPAIEETQKSIEHTANTVAKKFKKK